MADVFRHEIISTGSICAFHKHIQKHIIFWAPPKPLPNGKNVKCSMTFPSEFWKKSKLSPNLTSDRAVELTWHATGRTRTCPCRLLRCRTGGEMHPVTVTMRCSHSNLTSKVAAVGKLAGAATILLHPAPKCSSSNRPCRPCSKLAANSQNTLELKTEEWVSG
jgi:hypothetical protein